MKLMIALTLAALTASSAFASGTTTTPASKKNKRYIVTFKPTVKQAGREAALSALNVKALKHIATDGDSDNEYSAAVVTVPSGGTLALSIGKAFCKNPQLCSAALGNVVSIEEDVKVKWIEQAQVSFQATPLPSMGAFMEGIPMPNKARYQTGSQGAALAASRPELTWGVNRVRAPAAWDTTEGKGVRVAVIDTGIDYGHSDLLGKVDGGYSAITKTETPEDYMDDNGHGTHVAGTIGAIKDGKGVVGVAPKSRLYAVKVLDADGSGNLSDVIDGIVWAAQNDMQVANMSLGAPVGSDAMRRALRFAAGHGLIVVAAAGNSGGAVGFPGAYPETIAVAAADSTDKIAPFSSRGPEVDFIAPGVDVVSTKMGGGFVSYSGTSMAAPHVAGLAALTVSQGWTGLNGPDGVMNQLKKASKPLAALTAEEQGMGMIDAGKLTR